MGEVYQSSSLAGPEFMFHPASFELLLKNGVIFVTVPMSVFSSPTDLH